MKTFNKNNIPSDAEWKLYQKKVKTKAVRIEGSFIVETSEGPLKCQDGFLCIDARGYPYPVATEEFELIYQECK